LIRGSIRSCEVLGLRRSTSSGSQRGEHHHGPLSSTTRSLRWPAPSRGEEIAIIGHTDCLVGKTAALELIDRFQALGVAARNCRRT